MFEQVRLPPLFRLVEVGEGSDLHAVARSAAQKSDAGTIVCAAENDAFRCAVVLTPEEPLARSALVVFVGVLGLVDALGATVPPGLDVTVAWPNRIDANLGSVAEVTLDTPAELNDDGVPAWMILHVMLAVGSAASDYVARPFPATTLIEEGAGDIAIPVLLESFSRHFLTWMNRWEDDGFEPVRAMWLRHAPEQGTALTARDIEGLHVGGNLEGVGPDGALLVTDGTKTRRFDLLDALRRRMN